MQTKAHIRATTKYESNNIDKITLRLRKDGAYGITRDELQKEAEIVGESVNEYIIKAIKERMKK